MIQPLITNKTFEARPEVLRGRRLYGMFFGISLALAFAAWNWGMDAVILYRAHALGPWVKLVMGTLACLPVGALAGWLAMRVERGWFSGLVWLLAAVFFAWLSVALPFRFAPEFLVASNSVPSSFTPTIFEAMFVRVGLAFAWVAIFVLIAGLLELPMGESAAFSTSILGRLWPSIMCFALMGICGFIVDNLNNAPFRDPLVLTDQTIQFALDHRGQEVDSKTARVMHLSALRMVGDVLDQPRQLVVGEYDQSLGNIHVLVLFGDQWVDCLTVYSQLSYCEKINP